MSEKAEKPPILKVKKLPERAFKYGTETIEAKANYLAGLQDGIQGQYDALVAYYEPLIEQAQEQMGKLSASIAKSWQIVAQGQRDIDEVAIQQAKAEVAREIFEDLRKTLSKVDDSNYEIHRGDLRYLESKYTGGKKCERR